jgi:hypothetical protein
MRFFRMHISALALSLALVCGFTMIAVQPAAVMAQETTGGLQGTVKDASGAIVSGAKVVLTSPSLIGSKELITDTSGYYRFANLPPGTYLLTISAQGFKTFKRDSIVIEVGHLPTVDASLQVGAEATTVEVTGESPVIDTTTTQNMTNVNSQALQNLPTGISFQSVIQFAPMARQEPLAGMSQYGSSEGGSGGSMPGSEGNGNQFGYSIGGAADSESAYLVEGQDTENISGGYSKANVPMEFIQEVQVKTSGVEAEYGGALGGVINVIMRKGSNAFHGEIFSSYESAGTDANPVNPYVRYNPEDSGNADARLDPSFEVYQAKKDHFRTVEPGITVGGPIYKDRVWFFAGFEPLISSRTRTVNFGLSAIPENASAGIQNFISDRQTYFGNARIDATLSQKIRVFASWLYQYAREAGDSLPIGDPITSESSFVNSSINSPLLTYSHGLGWSAPNATYNVGADINLTQNIVATTRYGYFFDNYHDFGWPTSTPDLFWAAPSKGALDNSDSPLPASLQEDYGYSTTPYLDSFTQFNADKHYQFNQDFAFFKGGLWGTHNLKVGYQLNHLVNVISQNGNVPFAYIYAGTGQTYYPFTTTGGTNCNTLTEEWGGCTGQYGYLKVQDFATVLTTPASDWNHAFYAQDSWNVGKGVTFDIGLRIEKERLPAPNGIKVSSIDFSWSDKIEPRLGVAWDPTGKGKMKLFGSYGVVNDVMKLLLAQTSWGAQAYEWCSYPLGPDGSNSTGGFAASDIDLVFKAGRACPSAAASVGANFSTGAAPAGLTDSETGVSVIENVNLRPWEPVAPGVKPYRQHEFVAGWDYQISPNIAFEARYDRRRLDHVIEDASLSDPDWGETYTIVNPGEGVDSTIDGYASYLTSVGEAFGVPGWAFNADPENSFGTCPSCPHNPKAVRNYDGLELRVMLNRAAGFSGAVSYSYSSLWGNYTGLTTTDQTDGGTTGRNSPDTTRAFDEPFYYFGANGKSTNGPLPTDRPNVIKGQVYYQLPWKHQTTSIGLFQQFLQGSPVSSYIDLAGASAPEPFESTYIYGRGNWVNLTTDSNGNITVGTPYARRTPWYVQTDASASEEFKVGDNKSVKFEVNTSNLFNQRAVTAYWGSMDSMNFSVPLSPGGASLYSGAALYQALESGYNVQNLINTDGVIKNSQYGHPYLFQLGRTVRFELHYTF